MAKDQAGWLLLTLSWRILFALTSGVGYLMIMSGVGKSLLVWKRRTQMPVVRRDPPCSCIRA